MFREVLRSRKLGVCRIPQGFQRLPGGMLAFPRDDRLRFSIQSGWEQLRLSVIRQGKILPGITDYAAGIT